MGTQRVTLQDIAQATGYTVNTISRALKNKPDISKETCEKIQKTAAEMGYVRNYIASSLRSGRTKTLALICGVMYNPYYAIIADKVQQEADRLGYSVMLISSRDTPDLERKAIDMALSRAVDGILFLPCPDADENIARLADSNIPFVLLSRHVSDQYDSVVVDDEMGGYLAAQHLADAGHRSVAMFSSYQVTYSYDKRLKGFTRACEEIGIEMHSAICPNDELVCETLLRWHDEGVTGYFAFCDVEAWNAITLLENRGFRVPGDFSIIGFDNILGSVNFPKPICSVAADITLEVATAIDMIRNRIHHPEAKPCQITLPVSIVCRGSCT